MTDQMSPASGRCPNPHCKDGWVAWGANESKGAPAYPCRNDNCPHAKSSPTWDRSMTEIPAALARAFRELDACGRRWAEDGGASWSDEKWEAELVRLRAAVLAVTEARRG